ncbi:MAG: glycosyltransferase, partial [Candidatus Kapaibacterium sp.]
MEKITGQKSTQPVSTEQVERDRGRGGGEKRRHHRDREGGEPRAKQQRGNTTPTEQRSPLISVVIPLYNEEESLDELGERLAPVLQKMSGGSYEVIFVDDGSTDSSYEVLRRLNRKDKRFKAIRFRANYGKSAAL